MTGPILVGVDGSPESRAAVRWAAEQARLGGLVVTVHAIGLLARIGGDQSARLPAAGHTDDIRRQLEESWCEPLRRAGVRYRAELCFGPPAEALLRAAEAEEASLVVVGTRGTGRAASGLLGSTSARLARTCPVPLVIVPGVTDPST